MALPLAAPGPAASTASTPGPDVFVSYAREDRAFVERFRQALVDRGRTIWVDLEDILPTEDWWKKIRRGIESADHFVFVLSPSSASSEVCRRELAHAVENHKRLIPSRVPPLSRTSSSSRVVEVPPGGSVWRWPS